MSENTTNYADLIAQSPNRNIFWARVFVDELARCGLSAVCIAPGSRSTPLTLAFAEHPAIKVYSIIDERSCAFFALGLALASDQPVAMVCSSGTATANFHPAIIEARYANVPLLVLTADRPHELRESGANQTVDQVKMYGDHVLWSVDVALPEANPPAVAVRNLRTLADRAYAKANGIEKGPVHLNFPFRKPLEPTPVEGDVALDTPEVLKREQEHPQLKRMLGGLMRTDYDLATWLYHIIAGHEKGLIVCGPGSNRRIQAVCAQLSMHSGYPVIADAVSQVRFGDEADTNGVIAGGYNSYLAVAKTVLPRPDVVIRVGNMPTSQALNDYIEAVYPVFYVHVTENGAWADDAHLVTHLIHANPVDLLAITTHFISTLCRETDLMSQVRQFEAVSWNTIDQALQGSYFDGAAVYDVVDLIPEDSTLFVGNSLPVRHLDQFGKPTNKRINVYANRGASGIDGLISSALGTGQANPDKPLVLVIGDLSFYHDMNGLLAIKRMGLKNITIVLLNNDGGGIFNRLPIKGYEPHFTELFITPHGLEFEHAAKLYGLDYVRADDRESFRRAFTESVNGGGATIIEVRTDIQQDEARRQEIMAAVKAALTKMQG
jgi:2-succinyl-5-enolpyruvyl-6-hydroxy-3-cyclohexene-1-carboxylate synthase